MSVKIRLQRHGKKKRAFFKIVVADSRSPRDGRYIEKLGTYNPNTNPGTVELNADKAFEWLQNGAQPTETCKDLLSNEGVLLRNHLAKGVAKGALKQDEADKKLATWLAEKSKKGESLAKNLEAQKEKEAKDRLAIEIKAREVNEKKAAAAAEARAKKEADTAKEQVEQPASDTGSPGDGEAAVTEELTEEQTEKAPALEEVSTGEKVEEAPIAEEVPTEKKAEEAPIPEEAPTGETAEAAPIVEELPTGEKEEEAPVAEEDPAEAKAEEVPVAEEVPAEVKAEEAPVAEEDPAEVKAEEAQVAEEGGEENKDEAGT